MTIEALWSVVFSTPTGDAGGGVVILDTNRVFGGDGGYYYIGSYAVKDGQITMDIEVVKYNKMVESVFGPLQKFRLELKGMVKESQMTLSGSVIGSPQHIITISAVRRAELP